MKKVKVGLSSYIYYTLDEALERGIEFKKNWREGRQGDWVLTDDGKVAQIIYAGGFKKSSVKYLRIATGTFLNLPKNKMTTKKRDSATSFTGKKLDAKDPNRRLTPRERKFVAAYLTCHDMLEAFRKASKADPRKKSFKHNAIGLAGRANVQRAIEKGLREQFSDIGIDETWMGEQLKELGCSDSKEGTRLRAIELVGKLLGHLAQQSIKNPAAYIAISSNEIQQLEAESERLALSGARIEPVPTGEEGSETEDEAGHGVVREDDVPPDTQQANPSVS